MDKKPSFKEINDAIALEKLEDEASELRKTTNPDAPKQFFIDLDRFLVSYEMKQSELFELLKTKFKKKRQIKTQPK